MVTQLLIVRFARIDSSSPSRLLALQNRPVLVEGDHKSVEVPVGNHKNGCRQKEYVA
jgi:hypothetical protein